MLPEIKISYWLKVTEVLEDGFRAVSPDDKRLIKYLNITRDKTSLRNHNFKREDIVKVTLEFVTKYKPDILETNKVEFHIWVKEISSNGIYTKTYVEGENPNKTIQWYEARGMITSEVLEKNSFEAGDLIKVTIRRRM